ncbi:sigma-70 family RNA polymerase sigma factor [Fodinibius saliphilus]|uniref:sigma-70 family RNA polymerase sigma factor n=1 Tax=Fodinibius saliphilus TaxID=1920650 RepID=UPI001107D417|nr:sigma-70 family RNA polymerase sigma factor [Fodinibius saliphilus]
MTEQLWMQYSDPICNYFKKRTGDRALSCDLMQDTFTKIVDHRKQLDDIDNPKGWIYRIARNLLIDYRRKMKETSISDDNLAALTMDVENTDSNVNDIAECLHQLINEYEGSDQKILSHVFKKSITQKEMAQYLEIPYSTFKSRVQKARKEIIDEFNKRCCKLRYDNNDRIIGCAPTN